MAKPTQSELRSAITAAQNAFADACEADGKYSAARKALDAMVEQIGTPTPTLSTRDVLLGRKIALITLVREVASRHAEYLFSIPVPDAYEIGDDGRKTRVKPMSLLAAKEIVETWIDGHS